MDWFKQQDNGRRDLMMKLERLVFLKAKEIRASSTNATIGTLMHLLPLRR